MRCPHCDCPDSRVTDSRTVENGIRRRRECAQCGLRFTTYERVQTTALLVAKRDGRREEFNREKLTTGIVRACANRPVSLKEIEKVVEDIESELQRLGPRGDTRDNTRRYGDGQAEERGQGCLRPLRQRLPRVSGHREL